MDNMNCSDNCHRPLNAFSKRPQTVTRETNYCHVFIHRECHVPLGCSILTLLLNFLLRVSHAL